MKKLLLVTLLASPTLLLGMDRAINVADSVLVGTTKACSTAVAVKYAPESAIDVAAAYLSPCETRQLEGEAAGFRLGFGTAAAASTFADYSLLRPLHNTKKQTAAAICGLINTGVVGAHLYCFAQGKLSPSETN